MFKVRREVEKERCLLEKTPQTDKVVFVRIKEIHNNVKLSW